MRIVLVLSRFPALSETFIVSKFRGLRERGFDVHIFCNESQSDWSEMPHVPGKLRNLVHVVWPHRPRWLALMLLPFALVRSLFLNPLGTFQYLVRGARLFGLDVFRRFYLDAELVNLKPTIVNFEFGAVAVDRMHVGKLLGCRVIVSFRGYDLYKVGLQKSTYYHDVWENADALHLLGRDLWKHAQLRGCSGEKLHRLIPPAIDPEVFGKLDKHHTEKVGSAKRPFRILSVGRLEWEKGYDYALQAVHLLRQKGVECEYHIVGVGKSLDAITLAQNQLNLRDCTVLLHALPPSKVIEEMEWADVLLHAAVCEAFCNVVVESQAIGLPVVCTDAGGLRENLLDGETGFIVPRRNPRALAEKLHFLSENIESREKMGQAGRKRAFEHFLLKDQISAFVSLYEQVLGKEAGPEIEVLHKASASAHRI